MCGAGSDELLALLIHAYAGPGTEIMMSQHGFVMYEIGGTAVGAKVVKVPERNLTADVDALLAAVSPATRMVIIANPNNPTGSILPQSEMERLRAGLPPDVLLLIDAAYSEYVDRPDYDAGAKLVDAGDNAVMTRTFSKIFGMGGMRLGWCYGPPGIIDVLNRARGPFNVSLLAQEAGVAALAEPHWVEAGRAHNADAARRADGRRWRRWASRCGRARAISCWPISARRPRPTPPTRAAPPRHHRARHAGLRPAALPAHHRRHGGGMRPGGGGVGRDRHGPCLTRSSAASPSSATG